MIAHRGLSSAEPENTLPAFIAAGNRSYFGIETDVHKTVDGFYVVTHDDTTKRVANQELEVARSTFAQLRELPLKDLNGKTGRIDLRIPTLDEYLDVCRRYGKVGVLELKNEYPAQDIREILQIVKKHYALENMVFISFVWENLVCLQREEPSATVFNGTMGGYLARKTAQASLWAGHQLSRFDRRTGKGGKRKGDHPKRMDL